MDELKTNVLYFGDNLEILCKYIPDNSIDLIYLDPPFSSLKSYNTLFKESDRWSEAQIKAFSDTWTWDETVERTYYDILRAAPPHIAKLIDAMHSVLGDSNAVAYLVMMTRRLIELRRVLKDTGSLYLHCDPTAGHYLKLVLDYMFGPNNFINDIACYYGTGGVDTSWSGRKIDTIFLYAKSGNHFFNPQKDESYLERRRGLSNTNIEHNESGYNTRNSMSDVWDIPGLRGSQNEMFGYPTQKPLALLERIIKASSNEGDIVLDPFCGGGTAVVAAQKLNRRWIGIDITHLAIGIMRNRLKDGFGIDADIIGGTVDLAWAKALARQDTYQFQWWALSLIGSQPLGEKRKGADKGIDGVIHFIDNASGGVKRVVVQVKSGHVGVNTVRELKAVAANDAIGVLITLESPTSPMKVEAVDAGYYRSPIYDKDYTKIQILTIEELLNGKTVDMPPSP
ncbi:MAG TPA: site-specific DNA-methyltransferase [Dehalococcoidia bacterium]|nr:site-specific DNA-methyltransferase [Dehalococcoidia bacterium]